ncbi:hypothetical protein FKP32DRAFT_1678213 [Trametes sanguinea]|nr:hypothetical protein FKP32DRAFT_1678213 [Trametes sanguinea]
MAPPPRTKPAQACPAEPSPSPTNPTRLADLRAQVADALASLHPPAAVPARPAAVQAVLSETAATMPSPSPVEAVRNDEFYLNAARRAPGLKQSIREHLILVTADAITRGEPQPGMEEYTAIIPKLYPHPLPRPRPASEVLDELLRSYSERMRCGNLTPTEGDGTLPRSFDEAIQGLDWALAVEPTRGNRMIFNTLNHGLILTQARTIILSYAPGVFEESLRAEMDLDVE